MPPQPDRIGKYEVRGKLGEGRMGVVYLAYDPALEREVALKVMATSIESNEELRERFLQEAKAIARLGQHPNIVSVQDLGYDEQGSPYIAMERLHGSDLAARLRQDPPTFTGKLDIVIQILNGLALAHQKGIVHRDIKPANIFITDSGAVKIMDFGVARLMDRSQTQTGVIMGTACYMSPEQIRASKVLDGRSDVFSVGVILYHLLTGKIPFEADQVEAIFFKILRTEPPMMVLPGGRTVPELQQVVDRALAKDPAERYPDAESMARDLEIIRNKYRDVVPETLRFQTRDREPPPKAHVPPPRPLPPRTAPVPVRTPFERAAKPVAALAVLIALAYFFFRTPSDSTVLVEEPRTTILLQEEPPPPPPPEAAPGGDSPRPLDEPPVETAPPKEDPPEEPPIVDPPKPNETSEGSAKSSAAAALARDALLALNDGDIERAESLIAEGERLDPPARDWLDLRERARRARQDREANEIRRRTAEAVQGYLNQAYDHMNGERYEEALAAFQTALGLDPGNVAARSGIASVEKLKASAEQAPPEPASGRRIVASETQHQAPPGGPGGFQPGANQITSAPRLDADLLVDLEPVNVRSGEPYTLTVRLVNSTNAPLIVKELEIVSTFGQMPPTGRGSRLSPLSARVDPHTTGVVHQAQGTWKEMMNQGQIEVVVYLAGRGTLQKSIRWN